MKTTYSLAAIVLVSSPAYVYRIRGEESMLLAAFGEGYHKYMSRTWRLLPFLF